MAATATSETKQQREERLSTMQRERCERALTEDLQFTRTHERLTCYSVKSGKVYIVSERGCTCSDYAHRAGPNGLLCKHLTAAVNRGLL